jgi:hypothetical protein
LEVFGGGDVRLEFKDPSPAGQIHPKEGADDGLGTSTLSCQ